MAIDSSGDGGAITMSSSECDIYMVIIYGGYMLG